MAGENCDPISQSEKIQTDIERDHGQRRAIAQLTSRRRTQRNRGLAFQKGVTRSEETEHAQHQYKIWSLISSRILFLANKPHNTA